MAGPNVAERVRSVIATADSLRLTVEAFGCDLVGLHAVDDAGRLTLRVPADSALAARVCSAPDGDLAAVLEFTDVAPTAVRERVRARVALSGWLASPAAPVDGRVALDFDLAQAVLETPEGVVVELDPEDLESAEVDPLAADETALLLHLSDAHAEVVDCLTALVAPRVLQGVVRVAPVALDRHGLVLRVERAASYEDVRLPFPVRVRDRAEAAAAVHVLLTASRGACGSPARGRGGDAGVAPTDWRRRFHRR